MKKLQKILGVKKIVVNLRTKQEKLKKKLFE